MGNRSTASGPYLLSIGTDGEDKRALRWNLAISLWFNQLGVRRMDILWSRSGDYVVLCAGTRFKTNQEATGGGYTTYHGAIPAGTVITLDPVKAMLIGKVEGIQ